MERAGVCILGATGSVGRQSVEVIRLLDDFEIVALAAHSSYKQLAQLAHENNASIVSISSAREVSLRGLLPDIKIASIEDCINHPNVDIVINALPDIGGLRGTLAAIEAGKTLLLANKESLVAGGALVMAKARERGVKILPLDSEHSAIWQALAGARRSDLKRIYLTASGGAFRNLTREEIAKSDAQAALKHPNWRMGKGVTLNCATMMNKGLEYFEARWLFGVPFSQIEILLHPQSIVHSMVQFSDNSVIAQMGPPDMRQCIGYALTAPRRGFAGIKELDFIGKKLEFSAPDLERFPCLKIALDVAKSEGTGLSTRPAVMLRANEILIEGYSRKTFGFYDVSRLLNQVLERHEPVRVETIGDINQAIMWTRQTLEDIIRKEFF